MAPAAGPGLPAPSRGDAQNQKVSGSSTPIASPTTTTVEAPNTESNEATVSDANKSGTFFALHAQLCDPSMSVETAVQSLSDNIDALIRLIDVSSWATEESSSVSADASLERKFAYACLVKLFLYGSEGSARHKPAFAPLLSTHGVAISKIVASGVLRLIQLQPRSQGQLEATSSVFEAFFVAAHTQGLAALDLTNIMSAVVNAAEETTRNHRSLFRQSVTGTQHRSLFDGALVTLLLCATLGSAFKSMEMANESELIQSIESFLDRSGKCGVAFAELAIIRIMWGSCLGSVPGRSADGIKHADYAFRSGSSQALRALLSSQAARQMNDTGVQDLIRIVFWNILHLQYVAFSPEKFPRTPEEVEVDVDLAVTILSGCGLEGRSVASTQLWMHEYAGGSLDGTSSLLRVAGALFPLHFLPLVSLLSELCVDADTSIEADATLTKRLFSRMEALTPDVRSTLDKLPSGEIGAIQREIHPFFSTVGLISIGAKESSLLRADRDIPSSYGDTMTANATVALLSDDNRSVLWACTWNGWTAVSLALRSLHVLLSQPGADADYAEEQVTQLVSASLVALRLVERICRYASKEMRKDFCMKFDSTELVCDIFVAAADPPARNGGFLSNPSRSEIMSGAGACLHALTLGNCAHAQSVVDRIVLSASRSNALQACVTELGVASFPALASVTKIACSALDENDIDGLEQTGALRIMDFVRGIGLPLWLSVHSGGANVIASDASLWLLPAAALELFWRCPKKMLEAPAVSAVASTTIACIARSSSGADPLQFLALRHAIMLCIAVLEFRNAALDDALAKTSTCDLDLLSLERMLLQPEVVHALAVLASGNLPTSSEELQNSAAKCLALFITCLYKISRCTGNPIIQVPWPAMGHSSLGCWFGGGESIRHGFATRIGKSTDCAAPFFIGTVVSCGQRAAARALFGPASGKANPENEMLSAVVKKLKSSAQTWTKLATMDRTRVNECQEESMASSTSSVAVCVRILRTAWEVHGGVWLKEAWAALGVWKILAGLLRCRSGSSSDSDMFDLRVALQVTRNPQADAMMSDEQNHSWTKAALELARTKVDIDATWRCIVSDVLGIFASEVVFQSSSLAGLSTSAQTEPGLDGSNKALQALPAADKSAPDVFDGDAFTSLRDSFSEQWMHLFLDSSHFALLQSNVLPFLKIDMQEDTVEEMTSRLERSLTQLCAAECRYGRGSILEACRQRGKLRLSYGGSYAYSVSRVRQILMRLGLDIDSTGALSLLGDVVILNLRVSRLEAQLNLTRAFSALTTMIVMADSVAPTPTKMLTYASPQYCGKLCRVISHELVRATLSSISSPNVLAVHAELAILLGFVSARISPEELDQAALSSVRFDQSAMSNGVADLSQISPVAKLAEVISRNSHYLRPVDLSRNESILRLRTLRWLLLGAARLSAGTAFRADQDFSALSDAAMKALLAASSDPELCHAAAVAMSAVALTDGTLVQTSRSQDEGIRNIFASIASLARPESHHTDDERASAAAGLVLFMTKMATGSAGMGSTMLLNASALEHLSSGSVAAMLPAGTDIVPCYNPLTLQRESVHRLWCCSLSLASSLISQVEARIDISAMPNVHVNGVLEFVVSNASRMAALSLDSSGDRRPSDAVGNDVDIGRFRPDRQLTMARVEEAELVLQTIFSLAGHALDLRDTVPHAVNLFMTTSFRTVYFIYRVIRAEPVERWVRPVSEHERQRCKIDPISVETPSGAGTSSPWARSPLLSPEGGIGGTSNGRTNSNGLGTTPGGTGGRSARGGSSSGVRPRTPQQALQSALSRIGGRSSVNPPSPGVPLTPQLTSPMSVATAARSTGPSNKYQSPLSPWGSTGGGLITGSNVYFADEVNMSLLRGLAAGLGAIRRFSTILERPVLEPTVDAPSEIAHQTFGLVSGIAYHVLTPLGSGCEGERREVLMLIAENALVMMLWHCVQYHQKGNVPAEGGVYDQIHDRCHKVLARMRRLVPPCPSHSIVHTPVADSFLRNSKGA